MFAHQRLHWAPCSVASTLALPLTTSLVQSIVVIVVILVTRAGADQEPHTMGVDKVQGMNQALGE